MKTLFLVWFLPYLSNVGSAQTAETRTGIVYLNSTNPLICHNNSTKMTDEAEITVVLTRETDGGFSGGFYCLYYSRYCLFSVIAIANGDQTVVWSANRANSVSSGAVLQLTKDGDLVLRNYDGVKAWSTNNSGKSVAGMNMTQEGNLILFNKQGSVVWQYFDHPTDTLLFGQRFYEGQQLTSFTISSLDNSRTIGLYYATVSSTSGFSAYIRVDRGPSQMYY